MKKLFAFSSIFFALVFSFISSKLRFIAGYFILGSVALALGIAALWFIIPASPVDPLLHSKTGIPTTMFMTGKVTLLTDSAEPAAGAVAVINHEQQAQADANGVVYFSDLMMHDHNLDVVYHGEHYTMPLHVHSANLVVQLGLSNEFRTNIGYILAALFFIWLAFATIVLSNLYAKHPFKFIQTMITEPEKIRLIAFTFRKQFALISLLVVSLMVASLFLTAMDSSSPSVSAAGTTIASLAVPAKLAVEEDDNNAILSWGDPMAPDRPNPPNVTGYRVSWGLAGSGAASTIQLTSERAIQLQPLTNGQQYQAQVQSVDSAGNLSTPSQTVTFTGNPARVNALRNRMTGFFDDFNRAAGAFDELKWNQAYSACDTPSMSASFINTQFHAHNMELSGNCDRGQVVNRARANFDFTGRTGTVAFDLDGLTSRSIWYLDLIDKAAGTTDINSHISESGDAAGTPGNVLRIRQNDNGLSFQYVMADGNISTIADTDFNPYTPLDWAGFKTISNLRRHWELHISQQKIEVTINGKVVLAKAFKLPFSQATVHWNAFSYNTAKHNVPYALVHWDNFGFDGPAPTTETHNYRASGYAGRDILSASNNTPVSTQINIPDSVNGATAQRLMFTMQMRDYTAYQWKSTDKVVINGKDVAVPKPALASAVQDSGVSYSEPYSVRLELPAGTLITGQNQLSFVMNSADLLNIHLEVNFPKEQVPTYTQPSAIYSDQASQVTLAMPEVGPAVTIESLGKTSVTDNGRYTTQVFKVSGTVAVNAIVTHELAMDAMGKNPGISKIQLRLNKSPIYELDLGIPGAPASNVLYNFDTTRYTNGNYDLDIVAFNPSGAVSIPNYFEADAKAGDYYPIKLNISNSGTPSPTTPTTIVAPTSTTSPKPSATAAPPTVTPKPTATAVPPKVTPKPTATLTPPASPKSTATAVPPKVTPKPTTAPTTWTMSSVVKVASTSGGSTSIISEFTAPAKSSGTYILDVEVYNLADNSKVAQWFPTKTFTTGQTLTLTNSVKLKAGTYIVKQGVFTTNWTFIAWQDGDTFQVK